MAVSRVVGSVTVACLVAVAVAAGCGGSAESSSALAGAARTSVGEAASPAGTSEAVGVSSEGAAGQQVAAAPASCVDQVWAAAQRAASAKELSLGWSRLGQSAAYGKGRLSSEPAWSTIKVPLAVAALRKHGAKQRAAMRQAITVSDNAAAQQLWASLGQGKSAASAVDVVLREAGDRATNTNPSVTRPPFSAFGQTAWTPAAQVKLARWIAAQKGPGAEVYAAMGQVVKSQRWGLGSLPGAHFKGGWGPDRNGQYLVRQFGVVTVGKHRYAVGVAVRPKGGSFKAGTQALTRVAKALQRSPLAQGKC